MQKLEGKTVILLGCLFACILFFLTGCVKSDDPGEPTASSHVSEVESSAPPAEPSAGSSATADEPTEEEQAAKEREERLEELSDAISLRTDFHDEFVHGEKGTEFQKYIVLHDTEGTADADGVIASWINAGDHVAAHFIVNTDGTVVQCVPMDKIAHHAGFGDTGHNREFDVADESRDDRIGTKSIGSSYADYGMNSYSIGIEMVHTSGGGDYPEDQLEAVDHLIAYIDTYYEKESTIIDHKMWRSGNSDTSAEFATYLNNYRNHRTWTGDGSF